MKKLKILKFDMILHFKFIYNQKNYNFNSPNSPPNCAFTPMCSLPWAQHSKWISIRSMGCVHTHQGRPVVEKCGNISHVCNVVKKTKENNQKVGKINQVI
jgi:hypothetical protein